MATRNQRTRIIISGEDKSGKAFASAGRAAGALAKNVALVGAAAAAAAVAGVAIMTKESLKSIDALAKMSDKAGLATESLQAMHLAGELAGTSTQTVDKLLVKMNQSIGQATQGLATQTRAFDQLGLKMSELVALPADQKFALIADRINQLGDSATKTQVTMDIFGRSGADALNLISAGSKGLDAAKADIENLGLAISRVDAAKVEMANDAMTRLGRAMEGLGNRIAIAAAPYLKLIADLMTDGVANADWLKAAIDGLADFTASAVGAMADAWTTLKILWGALKLGILELSHWAVQGIADMDKSISDFAAKIPGLDWEPSTSLQEWADGLDASIMEVKADLYDLLSNPMPSEGIKASLEAARLEVENTAQVIAQHNTTSLTVTAETVQKVKDIEVAAEEDRKKRAEKRIKQEETEAERILRIWESGAQGKRDIMGKFFGDLSVLQETNSKKLFEVGKAAAIAQTVIDTHRAAMGAYSAMASIPYIGPALGIAAAAAAVAYGFARVQQIKSQSFKGGGSSAGGGGGAPGGGGAVPSPTQPAPIPPAANNNQAAPKTEVRIHLNNDAIYSGDEIRNKLIPALNDAIGDGAELKVAS